METLIQARSNAKSSQPYTKPLRLKVVAASQPREFRPDLQMNSYGLADATAAVRAVCFDTSKFRLFKEGQGIIVSNFSWKNGEIQIGQTSRVYSTSPPEVPQQVVDEAVAIIFPKEPPVVPITTAKLSPKGKTTSIKGKVISDGAVTQAKHKGNVVDVKVIQVADGADKVKVSLWRESALQTTTPGDFVQISHLYAGHNSYYNELTLSSTQHTHIKIIEEEPISQKVEVLGCDIGELQTEIVTLEHTFKIDNSLLSTSYDIEAFPSILPVTMAFKAKGSEIISIEKDSE